MPDGCARRVVRACVVFFFMCKDTKRSRAGLKEIPNKQTGYAMGSVFSARPPATTRDLFRILDNRAWYSFGMALIQRELKVDATALTQLICKLDHELQREGLGERVNTFTYNGVEYAGLESRRQAYERDRLEGRNHVERLIALGYYN